MVIGSGIRSSDALAAWAASDQVGLKQFSSVAAVLFVPIAFYGVWLAVRHGELAMVVVSERFALASLMLFDMRTALRDLAAGRAAENGAE